MSQREARSTASIVCVSGHRNIPQAHALRLPRVLERRMIELIEDGAVEFRAGGALGYDMVAELKILELQERFPHIRLKLYLPCRDQSARWSSAAQRAYDYILSRADAVVYTADMYTPGCMLARDRAMVDGSEVCLAYCTRRSGGTYYTCTYAARNGVKVLNVAGELEE